MDGRRVCLVPERGETDEGFPSFLQNIKETRLDLRIEFEGERAGDQPDGIWSGGRGNGNKIQFENREFVRRAT